MSSSGTTITLDDNVTNCQEHLLVAPQVSQYNLK